MIRSTIAAMLVLACTAREPDEQRAAREERERAELSRLVCGQIDHCSVDMWDIEYALGRAEDDLASTCNGLRHSTNLRAVAALRTLRDEWMVELEERNEDIRAAIHEVQCDSPVDDRCIRRSIDVMKRRAASRYRPPMLAEATRR